MLTPDQLALRRHTIGGSDVYHVLGMPDSRPYRLWAEKVHGVSRFRGTEDFIVLGNVLEQPVLRHVMRDRLVVPSARIEAGVVIPVTLRHPERSWQSFTPDGIEVTDPTIAAVPDLETVHRLREAGACPGLYEGKTNSHLAEFAASDGEQWEDGQAPDDDAEWGEDGSALVPERINAQVQWGMGICRIPVTTVGRLRFVSEPVRRFTYEMIQSVRLALGVDVNAWAEAWLSSMLRSKSAEVHTYRVMFDAVVFEWMEAEAERFVADHLRNPSNPPPVSKQEELEADIRRRFPRAIWPKPKPADDKQDALVEQYRQARIAAKEAEARADFLKALVQEQIADAPGLDASAGKVSLSRSEGRRTIDPEEALGQFAEQIQRDPRVGKLPAEVLATARIRAIEAATRQGEPSTRLNAPRKWTAGIADQTFARCAQEFGVRAVVAGTEE